MSGLEVWRLVSCIAIPAINMLCVKSSIDTDKLKNGELTAEKWRELIIPKLDDINSKLKGLAGVELLASVAFLREGVVRLGSSLETTAVSRGAASSSAGSSENQPEIENATAMITVTQRQQDVKRRTSELSQRIRGLNIESLKRYESAKESFKEAKRLATEAFHKVALNTEYRILASKLRIASRILECLDDPEAGVQDCLLYLTELQDLPAIQAMFSVWIGDGKGIMSRLRARFNQEKRNDSIKSMQMINKLLKDIVHNFTGIEIKYSEWPTIKTDSGLNYLLSNDLVLRTETSDRAGIRDFLET